MELEVDGDKVAGYAEFRWPAVYIMLGYDWGHWVIGIEYNEYSRHCLTIHALCFDCNIQWCRRHPTASVPQERK